MYANLCVYVNMCFCECITYVGYVFMFAIMYMSGAGRELSLCWQELSLSKGRLLARFCGSLGRQSFLIAPTHTTQCFCLLDARPGSAFQEQQPLENVPLLSVKYHGSE